MNKLTAEHLVIINQKVIEGDILTTSKVNLNQLKEVAEIPYQKNAELLYIYRTVTEKAAVLGTLIATQKPFADANQETAILALLTLLDINGYKMVNYSKDIEELYGYLKENKKDNACKWIEAHLADDGHIIPNSNY